MNKRSLFKIKAITPNPLDIRFQYVFAHSVAQAMEAGLKEMDKDLNVLRFEIEPLSNAEKVICVGDALTLNMKIQ